LRFLIRDGVEMLAIGDDVTEKTVEVSWRDFGALGNPPTVH
jgi:hypothetical protein